MKSQTSEVDRMSETRGKKQLLLQTFSLLVGFMVWTLLAPLFPEIVKDITEAASLQALFIALPMIIGLILRIPFSIITTSISDQMIYFERYILLLIPVFTLTI